MNMKKLMLTAFAVMVFALPLVAMAQTAPAAPAAPAATAPEKGSFTGADLATYVGLSTAVVAAIGALKKLFPAWVAGKEPILNVAISYVIGITAKLTIPGAFATVGWLPFLVSLLIVSAGAAFGHDFVVNKIVKSKPETEDEIISKTEGEAK